jgi:hypothetical protein
MNDRIKTIDRISFFSMFSNGIFIVIIRFYDPFYRFIIKQQFYEILFGKAIDEESDSIKT